MKPIAIDFKRRRPLLDALGLAALTAGLLAAGYVGLVQHELAARLRLAEQKVTRLEQTGARQRPARGADDATLQLEVRQANEILHQLALPWDGLFRAIESSAQKDVALLAVQPDVARRRVRLSGEARNLGALLKYIDGLERSGVLHDVYLTQHELRSQDPEKPVRFALVAAWAAQPTPTERP